MVGSPVKGASRPAAHRQASCRRVRAPSVGRCPQVHTGRNTLDNALAGRTARLQNASSAISPPKTRSSSQTTGHQRAGHPRSLTTLGRYRDRRGVRFVGMSCSKIVTCLTALQLSLGTSALLVQPSTVCRERGCACTRAAHDADLTALEPFRHGGHLWNERLRGELPDPARRTLLHAHR